MAISKHFMRNTAILAGVFSLALVGSKATAQVVIGGDSGVVIGGGQGLRIGGQSGVQFGGGQGAKFGGPSGVQFGGGAGAKFGGPSGVQFGGGQGAKFGGDNGVQFGGGAGAKIGPLQAGGQNGERQGEERRIDEDGETDQPAARRIDRPRPTTLYYPEDAKEPLDFTLNDHKFTVEPGQTVSLDSEFVWLMRFTAEPNGAERRYTLPPGSYTFKQKDGGWNLFRDKAPQAAVRPVPLKQ